MKHRGAILIGLAAALYRTAAIGPALKFALFFSAWLATGGAYRLNMFWHTHRRDLK